jgi:hypothetical protein
VRVVDRTVADTEPAHGTPGDQLRQRLDHLRDVPLGVPDPAQIGVSARITPR